MHHDGEPRKKLSETLQDRGEAFRRPELSAATGAGMNEQKPRVTVPANLLERGPAFGDEPAALLYEIRRATFTEALRRLNQRARALALQHLTSAVSVDWLAQFTHLADAAILDRVIALAGHEQRESCVSISQQTKPPPWK